MTDPTAGARQVVLGQIGEHAEPEPEGCRECGKSAGACGRSSNFCCAACSQTRFGTHYPAEPDAETDPAAGERCDECETTGRNCHVHTTPAEPDAWVLLRRAMDRPLNPDVFAKGWKP